MHLQENSIFDTSGNVAQHPLHHVTYSTAKFEVAMSNGLGDTFTRNVTDGRTLLQLDTSWVLTVLEKVAKKG